MDENEAAKRPPATRRRGRSTPEVVLDALSDQVILVDANTFAIIEANRAFLETYGLTREEAIGRTCHAVTHQLDVPCHQAARPCSCPVAMTAAGVEAITTEHVHRDAAGKEICVETTGHPVRDDDGVVTAVVHVSRDVTELRALERELRAQERLRAAEELGGGASHELNQPLTVVLMGLSELSKRLPEGSEEGTLARAALTDVYRLVEVSRRLGRITTYATRSYAAGQRIVDLFRSSDDSEVGSEQ